MSIKITEEGKTLLEDAILQDKKVVFSQIELIADTEKSPTEMVKRVDVSKVSASDYNTITVQAQVSNDGFYDTYYFNRANVYADEVLFAYDDGVNICIPAETTKVINDLEMMMKIDSAVADLKIIYEGYVLRKDFDDMESKIQKINATIKDMEANAVTQNDCTDQVSWNSQIVKKEFLTIGNMAFFRAMGRFSAMVGGIDLATLPEKYLPESTDQSQYELIGVFTSAYDKERRNCYVTLNCLSRNINLQINNNGIYSDTRTDDDVEMIFYGFWKMNAESQSGTGGSISYREDIENLRQSIQDSKKEIVRSNRDIDSLKEDLDNIVTKSQEYVTIDKNMALETQYLGYAGSTGLKKSNEFLTYNFSYAEDVEVYVDLNDLGNYGTYFSIVIYTDAPSISTFVSRYRLSENNLPTENNKLLVEKGNKIYITISNTGNTGANNNFKLYSSNIIRKLNSSIELSNVHIKTVVDKFKGDLKKWIILKNGDDIEIVSNGNGVRFKRFGCNNLLQVYQWIMNDISITLGSDTLGPYQVLAIENIDGDGNYVNGFFTGGIHGFEGSTSNNATATARLVKYSIFIDGQEITKDGSYSGNVVTLTTINNIQACNTAKQSGGGREVLAEEIVYRFDELVGFSVINTIEALEKIRIISYYGLQLTGLNDGVKTVYTDEQVYTIDGKPQEKIEISANKRPFLISCESDIGKISMMMDKVGLGSEKWNQSVVALISTTGKAYYEAIYYNSASGTNVIYDIGEKVFISGKYLIGK